ncbi:MAG: TIGR01777 family oxidoreductase [Dehalococcoidia bacterium]
MNILVFGGTGFIGRPVIARLQGRGHNVRCLSRDTARAKDLLGEGVDLLDFDLSDLELIKEIELADVIINLAGEQLAGVRWSESKKKKFHESREGINKLIVNAISNCKTPPSLFISASAVGVYGDRGNELLTEDSLPNSDYLSQLCLDWEDAAIEAEKHGVRVCTLRLGVVLGREGGVLKQVMPTFELGVGTYLGDRDQKVPWVHIFDVVRVVEFCIDTDIEGPVNVVAPKASTSINFAKILKNITKAKILIHIPYIALRIVFASGAKVLTNSQNAVPEKLLNNNFEFKYSLLEEAIKDEVAPGSIQISKTSRFIEVLKSKGQYQLKTSVTLNSSAEETFSFFGSPLNLGLSTPDWLGFRIIDIPDEIMEESKIVYKIKLGLVYMKWCTVIAKWHPSDIFVDFQAKGPYSLWWHEHSIKPLSQESSVMEDCVTYKVPFGIFGRIAHYLFIKKILNRIFNYRRFIMILRFG